MSDERFIGFINAKRCFPDVAIWQCQERNGDARVAMVIAMSMDQCGGDMGISIGDDIV